MPTTTTTEIIDGEEYLVITHTRDDGSVIGVERKPNRTPPAPLSPTLMTVLAFRQRITDAKMAAIEMASIDDPTASAEVRMQRALLRVMRENLNVASFVDVSRADVRDGLALLVTAGLLTAGERTAILDTPLQPHEIYRG